MSHMSELARYLHLCLEQSEGFRVNLWNLSVDYQLTRVVHFDYAPSKCLAVPNLQHERRLNTFGALLFDIAFLGLLLARLGWLLPLLWFWVLCKC
jgi:hypothetical protein